MGIIASQKHWALCWNNSKVHVQIVMGQHIN